MTYRLQDKYDYILPELPSEHEILYYDLPKEEQYWRREEWDFKEINEKWSDDQKIKFVTREIRRRTYGLYFYNKGVITYISGSHYFFLQYWKMPTKEGMTYATFRRYQKEFYYFLNLTRTDDYCEGGAVAKPRRVGVTAMKSADTLNLAMLTPDRKFSYQSKKLDDAIENNFEPIKYNLERYPSIKLSNGAEVFAPKIAKITQKKIILAAPQEKVTGTENNKKRRAANSKTDELNTQIYVVATVENADDGKGTFEIGRDEVSKYDEKINIMNMLRILRPVCKVGTTQVGKIYFFTTSDEEDTGNFENWKTIYFGSSYANRINRKTEMGLYNYFIDAKYSIEGKMLDENDTEIELFDKYGECNEELALAYINNEKRPYIMSGDLSGLQAITRQYPTSEREAFESSSTATCYDNPRLSIQEHEIEIRLKNIQAGREDYPFVTVGNLIEIVRDREVVFNPDKNGHWHVYHLPDDRWKNKTYTDRYGYLNPDDTSPYLWTADPPDYREFINDGSKSAIVIGSMADSSLPYGGEALCARYLHRPINPNDVIKNVRMAAIFWAAKGMPETNKAWLATDLMKGRDDDKNDREKMGRFLLTWDKDLRIFRQWRYNETEIAGFYSGSKSIEMYVRDTAMYLKEIHDKTTPELDRIKTIWDTELIKQLKAFDPTKTTKFDLAVAFSIFCTLLKNYKQKVAKSDARLSDSAIMKAWFGINNTPKREIGVY